MSELIGRPALKIHFELKQRGSGFSDVARRVSRGGRRVTPQNVRGVVYGYMTKHAGVIWAEIEKVLAEPDTMRLAA